MLGRVLGNRQVIPIPNKSDNFVASPCRAVALSAALRLILTFIGNWNKLLHRLPHENTTTTFAKESEFEAAVIHELRQRGWGDADVIKNPSEADLLANCKRILFENNRGQDRLNEVPLADGEMQQVGVDKAKLVALMNTHETPANLNEFGRFDDLKATVDQQKAKAYFEGLEGKALPLFRVNIRTAKLLQDFIVQDSRVAH